MRSPLDLYSGSGDWSDYGGDPGWDLNRRFDRDQEKEPGPRLRPHKPRPRARTRGVP